MSVRSRLLGPPVPKMPSGLIELMDGLARDVLKNNPGNIYEFCAQHMQTLLEIRDGRALKPLLTLEQKIEKAQKVVKQRAEQRQRSYDKQITDDVSKQQIQSAADAPRRDDGVEKKVSPEENINVLKEQVPETPTLHINEPTEIDNKNDDLTKVNDEELEEEKRRNNNESEQEVLTVVHPDNKEDNSLLTELESKRENSLKSNGTDNNIENDLSNENNIAELTIGDNDDGTESLSNDATIKLEDGFNEETITLPEDNGVYLYSVGTEVVENGDRTELINVDKIDMKETPDEMQSIETTEKEVLSTDNNPQDNIHFSLDSEKTEKHIDVPSTNNPTEDNGAENTLNTDNNENLKQSEDLSEPEKSRDEEILTIILNSTSTESSLQNNEADTVQPDELDCVQIVDAKSIPNEVDQISEQNIDGVSPIEPTHDIEKTDGINSSMDLETAAITIQKVFRSFLFKTKTASYDDSTSVDINLLTEHADKEETEVLNIKDRRPLGISRMDTVLQTVNEEKSLSLSTDDSSTLSSAATIIQAHVRGFLVRNKLNLNKTISSNSLIDSDAPSIPSLEADSENINKNKTVLNIHIVPEGGHFVSRDESILTSMDLSLDSSPPSSVNLHPLGYDKSERRKQLKREDAIQSVSPPSNNSGKLSEDHDSVKEVLTIEKIGTGQVTVDDNTLAEANDVLGKEEAKVVTETNSNIENSTIDAASDEMDVVTPFVEDRSSRESDNSSKLLHSGEFHDVVVPTNVTRSDTSVVRGE